MQVAFKATSPCMNRPANGTRAWKQQAPRTGTLPVYHQHLFAHAICQSASAARRHENARFARQTSEHGSAALQPAQTGSWLQGHRWRSGSELWKAFWGSHASLFDFGAEGCMPSGVITPGWLHGQQVWREARDGCRCFRYDQAHACGTCQVGAHSPKSLVDEI